jgi:hypothetical protein
MPFDESLARQLKELEELLLVRNLASPTSPTSCVPMTTHDRPPKPTAAY